MGSVQDDPEADADMFWRIGYSKADGWGVEVGMKM